MENLEPLIHVCDLLERDSITSLELGYLGAHRCYVATIRVGSDAYHSAGESAIAAITNSLGYYYDRRKDENS